MRQITKDIEITVDGSATGFRLSKLDAFSGVMLLRLLMRLENQNTAPTMLGPDRLPFRGRAAIRHDGGVQSHFRPPARRPPSGHDRLGMGLSGTGA